ncbi:hypothetical protein H0H93_001279 [Arthromyces matolae]|nr:hypothetical protein H0H93_001279 [Arthromyces matolae]
MSTDVVFLDTLQLSANIGPDCWGKARPQPVLVSIYLHLQPSFLNTAGLSDDVRDSVHYGHLSKAISSAAGESSFTGVEHLVSLVNQETFALARTAAAAVRVVVNLPKQIPLAQNFLVDVITTTSTTSRKVLVQDLILPVLIGVNPPEREAKQRVITNIEFHEELGTEGKPLLDYPAIVKQIVHIVRTACLASEDINSVTVRAQKPSAVSFAHSSGVEITRRRADYAQQ